MRVGSVQNIPTPMTRKRPLPQSMPSIPENKVLKTSGVESPEKIREDREVDKACKLVDDFLEKYKHTRERSLEEKAALYRRELRPQLLKINAAKEYVPLFDRVIEQCKFLELNPAPEIKSLPTLQHQSKDKFLSTESKRTSDDVHYSNISQLGSLPDIKNQVLVLDLSYLTKPKKEDVIFLCELWKKGWDIVPYGNDQQYQSFMNGADKFKGDDDCYVSILKSNLDSIRSRGLIC
jgi:hypothetical protein